MGPCHSKRELKVIGWTCLALTISWTELKQELIVRCLIATVVMVTLVNDKDNSARRSDEMEHCTMSTML